MRFINTKKEVNRMEISLSKIGDHKNCTIDGNVIPGVSDYRITSFASGKAKLVLVIDINGEITSTTIKE